MKGTESRVQHLHVQTACVTAILKSLELNRLRACLHEGGGPQVGEVARLGGVTRQSI